ncbi:MAG: RnfABCDGE type electron transport complex subunit G [Lachnospiraceae bacterium]|nr:RnfABCDGE type electron transport complex subunit G [Lachnospiraceae bacterium]
MKTAVKNILCLFGITLVAGLGLGYVHDVTKEPIAAMEEKTKIAAYRSVFPEAETFTDIEEADVPFKAEASSDNGCEIDSVSIAKDASGNPIGYVMSVTSREGYGGDITVSMGIDNEGTVKGIEMLKISETAGLGMKAKESAFKDQFRNKNVAQFSYTKTGAASDFEIDAISGATITTKAVTNAVNTGLEYFARIGGAR